MDLTDAQIAALMAERKPWPTDINSRLKTKPKRGHLGFEVEIVGSNGSEFCIKVRQSVYNALAFSVILGYRLPGLTRIFRLRRYNGSNHRHTNSIEGTRIEFQFHIHEATQRYQELGGDEEGYAEAATSYTDLDGYKLDERDLAEGTRKKIFEAALSQFGVYENEGELTLSVVDEQFGDALFAFVQALLRVSDVTFLSREHVKSTFMEDLRALVVGSVSEGRVSENWHDPVNDPKALYPADFRVNEATRPLVIFGLPNDNKVKDATIALAMYERWEMPVHSLGVFEDQEEINSKVLARFSELVGKQFPNLSSARQRFSRYLGDVLTWQQTKSGT